MRVDLFDFHLPEDRIASYPAEPRDASKLLCVGKACFYDRQVRDLPTLLSPGDLLIFNQSKVIPARLYGKRGEAKIEILLHKNKDGGIWETFARPAKKLKPGDKITFAANFSAIVKEKTKQGLVQIAFEQKNILPLLDKYGQMPLPPYIPRHDTPDESDKTRYQTVYAKTEGSVAAPTAGLHFTKTLLEDLTAHGINTAFVTLHVGGGTFLPVKTEDTADHVMHSEWGEVSSETADLINHTRKAGGKIVAVGTTSLRLLESAANDTRQVQPFSGETAIFITPGYRFKVVDRLLTNFHLPKSTLFMLVAAFAGLERMKDAYAHAIEHDYRFYSYGDACLLEPQAET
ncbi:MAG: tRNA preQ1(34) S-adenosylmethionine ribosyltransferase-isomerase QueA [Rickettsiales bacterium]